MSAPLPKSYRQGVTEMGTTPADRARWALADLLDRWVEEHHPAALAGLHDGPLGRSTFEALAYMRAALTASKHLRELARKALLDARAQGHRWSDIYPMLGLADVEEAYAFADHGGGVWWTCSTCHSFVEDRAVFVGGADAERGHDRACPRWLADLDAWRRWESAG